MMFSVYYNPERVIAINTSEAPPGPTDTTPLLPAPQEMTRIQMIGTMLLESCNTPLSKTLCYSVSLSCCCAIAGAIFALTQFGSSHASGGNFTSFNATLRL